MGEQSFSSFVIPGVICTYRRQQECILFTMIFRYIPRSIFYASLLGLMLRMLLAAQPFYNFDVESYSLVAGIVREGGNVYAETIRYNYSPLCLTC